MGQQSRFCPFAEGRQIGSTVSEAVKEVEGFIRSRKIAHDGDLAMTWMLSNVVAKLDAKDNVYPRKERPENKIDGPAALIIAMGRMLTKDNAPSPYERLRPDGFLFV